MGLNMGLKGINYMTKLYCGSETRLISVAQALSPLSRLLLATNSNFQW